MGTLDCFDVHDLVLNDDDDIQDAYCKLYNFCMKSLEYSTKLKAKFKNQISSQVDKIKSLEEQLAEFKIEVEKLTSAKLVVEPNSKEKDFYIPPFKRNRKS